MNLKIKKKKIFKLRKKLREGYEATDFMDPKLRFEYIYAYLNFEGLYLFK